MASKKQGFDIQKEMRKVGDDFLEALRDEVDSCVFLGDTKRLDRLVTVVKRHLAAELMETLQEKGLGKELDALCDKAGRIVAPRKKLVAKIQKGGAT